MAPGYNALMMQNVLRMLERSVPTRMGIAHEQQEKASTTVRAGRVHMTTLALQISHTTVKRSHHGAAKGGGRPTRFH